MANWVEATVIKNHHWNDDLFSLTLDAPVEAFTAGQFTKLALDIDGTRVQRAYSYVNSLMPHLRFTQLESLMVCYHQNSTH